MRRRLVSCALGLVLLGCADSHVSVVDAASVDAFAVRPTRRVDGWDVYTVDQRPLDPYGLGENPQLVIDPSGGFHIAHVHQDTGEVLYSRGRPGDFRTEHVGTIDATPTTTGAVSEAVALDGTVHITYSHDPGLGPTHAFRGADANWSSRALPFELGPQGADQPAVAIAPSGTLVFVGAGPTQRDGLLTVHAMVGDGAPVSIGTADDWASTHIAATVTTDGTVHAIFDTYLTRPAGVATFVATRAASGVWGTRRIPDVIAGSIAAGPDGALHLAYVRHDGETYTLVHSVGPADDSSQTEATILEQDGVIQGTSIAVSSSGVVHIAFEEPGVVHYATDADGGWRTEEIEIVSTQNGRPVVALDPTGAPWLAYRDGDGALVVATPRR